MVLDPYMGYIESPSFYYTPDKVYPTWSDFYSSIPTKAVN